MSNTEYKEVVRRAYICKHCEYVYADETVTSCDCMQGSGADFIIGSIIYIVEGDEP